MLLCSSAQPAVEPTTYESQGRCSTQMATPPLCITYLQCHNVDIISILHSIHNHQVMCPRHSIASWCQFHQTYTFISLLFTFIPVRIFRTRSTEFGFLVSRYMKPPPPAPASDMPSTWGSIACIIRVTSSGSQPGAIFFFSCQYSDMHWPTPARSPGNHKQQWISMQFSVWSLCYH